MGACVVSCPETRQALIPPSQEFREPRRSRKHFVILARSIDLRSSHMPTQILPQETVILSFVPPHSCGPLKHSLLDSGTDTTCPPFFDGTSGLEDLVFLHGNIESCLQDYSDLVHPTLSVALEGVHTNVSTSGVQGCLGGHNTSARILWFLLREVVLWTMWLAHLPCALTTRTSAEFFSLLLFRH